METRIGLLASLSRPVRNGELFYMSGKDHGMSHEEALRDLTEVIRLDPSDSDAFFNRGILYSALGMGGKALSDYTEAIRLKSSDPNYFCNRGVLHKMEGRYTEATRDYDEAIRLDPSVDRFFMNRGILRSKEGKLKEAMDDHNEAIRLNPKNACCLFNRGNLRGKVGEFEKALSDYDKAILIDPTEAHYFCNRGVLHKRAKRYEKALRDYTMAIRLRPSEPDHFSNRAIVHKKCGNYQKALRDYTEAIRLQPSEPSYYSGRGSVYTECEKYEKALSDYSEAIRLQPSEPSFLCGRGIVHKKCANYEEALRDCTEAIRLNPSEPNYFTNRGLVHKKRGKYPEALRDYTEAIRLRPMDSSIYCIRAFVHECDGRPKEAMGDYNEAIRLNPMVADYFFHRGLLHDDGENPKEAIKDYSEAIRLNPMDPDTFHNRGRVFKSEGMLSEAMSDFNEAIRLNPADHCALAKRAIMHTQGGRHKEALSDYGEAIRLKPSKSDYFYNRGLLHKWEERSEEALSDYNDAIRLKSSDARYFYSRGLLHYNEGRYPEAFTDVDTSIRLNPNRASVFFLRGVLLERLKKHKKALADLDKAISIDPGTAMARMYGERADVLEELGFYERSRKDYNKAIELDDSESIYYHNRGALCESEGKTEEAIVDYTKSIELEPGKASAYSYHRRGVILEKAGRIGEAIEDYDRAIGLDSENPKFRMSRGSARVDNGDGYRDNELAILDFDAAVRLSPKPDAAIYIKRGLTYQSMSRMLRALANFDQAIRLKSTAEYHNIRGLLHKAVGRKNAAKIDFHAAGNLKPGCAEYKYQEGCMRFELDNVDLARECFDAAIELDNKQSRYYRSRGDLNNTEIFEDAGAAISDYTDALVLEPGDTHCLYRRGFLRVHRHRFYTAMKDFREATQSHGWDCLEKRQKDRVWEFDIDHRIRNEFGGDWFGGDWFGSTGWSSLPRKSMKKRIRLMADHGFLHLNERSMWGNGSGWLDNREPDRERLARIWFGVFRPHTLNEISNTYHILMGLGLDEYTAPLAQYLDIGFDLGPLISIAKSTRKSGGDGAELSGFHSILVDILRTHLPQIKESDAMMATLGKARLLSHVMKSKKVEKGEKEEEEEEEETPVKSKKQERKSYADLFQSRATELYANRVEMHNVSLCTEDGGVVFAHMEILVCRSEFFYRMIEFDGPELDQLKPTKSAGTGELTIKSLSTSDLEALVFTIYTGTPPGDVTLRTLLVLLLHSVMYRERFTEWVRTLIVRKVSNDISDACAAMAILENANVISDLPKYDLDWLSFMFYTKKGIPRAVTHEMLRYSTGMERRCDRLRGVEMKTREVKKQKRREVSGDCGDCGE